MTDTKAPSPGPFARAVAHQARLFTCLGVGGYWRFRSHQLRSKLRSTRFVGPLTARDATFPMLARGPGSDLDAFNDIWVRRQYDLPLDAPAWFVDCGANSGYASCRMLSRFPDCRALAIEADADNVEILRQNLAPYGDRAVVVHAAVWSHETELTIAADPYRDGRDWSRQVGPPVSGRPMVPATTVTALLARHGVRGPTVLKMDIEGAEAVVLKDGPLDWIDAVDCLLIELHEDTTFGSGGAALAHALAGRAFERTVIGETTVCRRIKNAGIRDRGH